MNIIPHPATVAHRKTSASANPKPAVRRTARLARHLFEVEVGLYLLSELDPSAAPSELPLYLADTPDGLTARQQRLWQRGRAILFHFTQPARWQARFTAYVALPPDVQAFDVSHDGRRFSPKLVGFSRNRMKTLRLAVA